MAKAADCKSVISRFESGRRLFLILVHKADRVVPDRFFYWNIVVAKMYSDGIFVPMQAKTKPFRTMPAKDHRSNDVLCDVFRPVRDDDTRPGAADSGQCLTDDAAFIDPAAFGGGLDHAVFA